MKKLLILCSMSLLTAPALANQFDQLYQIEQQNQRAQAAAEAERLRLQAAEDRRAEAREAQNRRDRAAAASRAAEQRRIAANAAAQQRQAKEAEAARLRSREESYEDDLRALELEERRLELQAKRARVARSNDYIDAELRDKAARTDVVQSEADSARNVTQGAKSLLEDSGTAEIKRAGSLFGN